MPFITQGKTNFKYIIIVVASATLFAGGIFIYQRYYVSGKDQLRYPLEEWTPEPNSESGPESESELESEIKTGPYLELISPNGGEKLNIGDDYKIKWDSQGVSQIKISIVDYRAPELCMLNDRNPVSAETGEYSFKLESCTTHNAGMDQKKNLSAGDEYQVRIEDVAQPETLFDFSDNNFSIVDWETYRNEEYGFEINYPTTTRVVMENVRLNDKDIDLISLGLPSPDTDPDNFYIPSFAIVSHKGQNSIRAYIDDYKIQHNDPQREGYVDSQLCREKEVLFGFYSYPAVELTNCSPFGSTSILLQHPTVKDTIIEFSEGAEFWTEEKSDLLSQIFSTFRFIE